MFDGLLQLIEQYEIITIYRHINEDGDALGSQFGLKTWIKETYPNKQVYALGKRNKQVYFPQSDDVNDEVIKNSLAIIVDCGNAERVDDQRFLSAKCILTIDHHHACESFMVKDYRDASCASCAELITEFILTTNKPISKDAATYLYMGILSDTASFRINATSSRTFRLAASLCDTGLDMQMCIRNLNDIDEATFKAANYLRSHVQVIHKNIAYVVMNRQECSDLGMSGDEIKSLIYNFRDVKEYEIYAVFTETESNLYNGSLRSKNIVIRKVATMFNGGGHDLACGVKNLTLKDIEKCIFKLGELL